MMASTKSLAVLISAFALCLSAIPSHATLLRGYLNHTQVPIKTEQAVTDSSPEVSGPIQGDSFPVSYIGTWRVQTEVIDSAAEIVSVGVKMSSNIEFVRLPDGRVIAHWNQEGWTESQASITSYNSKVAQIDRTNYYYGEQGSGAWAARSHDNFTQIAPDKMLAQSYVDQYIDGQYLGRYRTRSTLSRIDDSTNLALIDK